MSELTKALVKKSTVIDGLHYGKGNVVEIDAEQMAPYIKVGIFSLDFESKVEAPEAGELEVEAKQKKVKKA